MFDAIVCGGGPAGLAAALWLGRYRRKTLLLDSGEQRNLSTGSAHGYLGLDTTSPAYILSAARRDLDRYTTVEYSSQTALTLDRSGENFIVGLEETEHTARRVVLATGVKDALPDIPGFSDYYGRTIFHCSCCDGYEASEQRVAAIGWASHAAGFALDLLEWGADVTLLTNGHRFEGGAASEGALRKHEIEIIEEPVVSIQGTGDRMAGLELESGRILAADRAFFSIAHEPRSELAASIGCAIDGAGYIEVDDHGQTNVEGIYAVGDVTPGEQLIQTAAAEGAVAGIACAMSLRGEYTSLEVPDPGPDPDKELP